VGGERSCAVSTTGLSGTVPSGPASSSRWCPVCAGAAARTGQRSWSSGRAVGGRGVELARLLGAPSPKCVVFVRGTTEGVNLLASTLGRQRVGPGDDIVVTTLEHHSNIVPCQMLAKAVGARLRAVPVDDSGQVLLDRYAEMLTARTKVVALSHLSNALGTVLPVESMIALAHERGIPVVVDGAQAVAHMPVDVVALDADFYVLSGHKLFGPTGIGAVYGRRELLESLPPWQGGGSMIHDVTFERTTYSDPPQLFEAGTPSIADAVGLGAAVEYVLRLGWRTSPSTRTGSVRC